MRDDKTLDFVADRGSRAKFVTPVGTGSLTLGAAGLLKGRGGPAKLNTVLGGLFA